MTKVPNILDWLAVMRDEETDEEQKRVLGEAYLMCATYLSVAPPPPCSAEGEQREAVRWFAEQMERKLRANDHKGHWSNCNMGYLLRRLAEELDELRRALMSADGQIALVPSESERIIGEAADVANFAMMIADNARLSLKTTPEPR